MVRIKFPIQVFLGRGWRFLHFIFGGTFATAGFALLPCTTISARFALVLATADAATASFGVSRGFEDSSSRTKFDV
jgi:hypothetical protein